MDTFSLTEEQLQEESRLHRFRAFRRSGHNRQQIIVNRFGGSTGAAEPIHRWGPGASEPPSSDARPPLMADYSWSLSFVGGSCEDIPAIAAIPISPPRFIVSTALDGTMISEPRACKPSNSMFIARRWSAVGLSR